MLYLKTKKAINYNNGDIVGFKYNKFKDIFIHIVEKKIK